MQADEMFEKQVSILIWILRQKEEIMNQNSHSLSM
jgi:flagellar biosynthesis regulator FlaF